MLTGQRGDGKWRNREEINVPLARALIGTEGTKERLKKGKEERNGNHPVTQVEAWC
jgi:hypothetical protein